MIRRVLLATLAAATILLPLAAAAPASASPASECAASYLATEGRHLISVDDAYIPPPLRGSGWTCASTALTTRFTPTSASYELIYPAVAFAAVIDIFRSFEAARWVDGREISILDTGSDTTLSSTAVGADELAALSAPPATLRSRFSDANTGRQIMELTYYDSDKYKLDAAFTEPVLVVYAQIDQLFDTTGLTDPSAFSNLRTLAEAAPSPTQAAVAGGSAVMLMLIVGYPGSLLNAVIGERYDSAMAALRRRFQRKPPPDPNAARSARIWLIFAGLAIAAVISGFIDPDFGVNPMSARVVVTAFLTLLLFNAGGWLLVRAIMRRRAPDSAPMLRLRWGSLVLLALTVLIARLLGFDPGVIFGLVVGLTFAITLSASRDATVVLLGSGFALAFAAIAWIGYSILAPIAGGAPGNLPLVFTSEFFSAITIEGISSLPIALLPLLALDGRKLFAWRRWVWAVGYVVGLAAFAIVMFTIPDSWGAIGGDFAKWVLLFVIFGVVAVAVWVINAVVTRRSSEASGPPAEPA